MVKRDSGNVDVPLSTRVKQKEEARQRRKEKFSNGVKSVGNGFSYVNKGMKTFLGKADDFCTTYSDEIGNTIGAAVTIGVIAGGVYFIGNLVKDGSRERDIKMYATQGHFVEAKEKLTKHIENKEFSKERSANLIDYLNRAKAKFEFNETLKSATYEGGLVSLEKITESGFFSDGEIEGFRSRVEVIEPNNMYSTLLAASEMKEKEKIALDFLNRYPDSEKLNDVSTELVYSKLSQFKEKLDSNPNYSEMIMEVININGVLGEYSSFDLSLPENFISEVVDSLETYLDNSYMKDSPSFTEGSKVFVSSNKEAGWNDEYRFERDQTIPVGSVGEIVAVTNNKCFVEFDGIENYGWSREWGFEKVWTNGEKNVATYLRGELTGAKEINDLAKQRFENLVVETKVLLGYER